jgi:CRISPR-associated endonuclease Csn1
MVSCNKKQCFFMPQAISKVIKDKTELGSLNKEERDCYGRMIKQICIKLTVNRIGEILPA